DPGVARLLPHRDARRRKARVGEIADGDGNVSGKTFPLPVDGGAAGGTEMEGQGVAAFCSARPRGRLAGEGNLVSAEPRLVADDGTRAALAFEAMAHGDACRLAFDREVKLSAAACGTSGGHRSPRAVDTGEV